MAIRRWLATGLAVCALTTAVWARPGIVKTHDATYTGDVTQDEDGNVVVKVHGIDMRIDRHDVASVQYVDDVQKEFQKKLTALPPKDVNGRLDLAKWAFNQKQYDLSRQAAQAALDADPNSKDATDFLMMVRKQQELEHAAKPAEPKPAPGSDALVPDQPATPAGTQTLPEKKFITADDLNVIRQFELGAQEDNFRANLVNDVRKRFTIKDNGGTLAEFSALPVQKQARLILTRAAEMRNDVRIMSDPASITMYKQRIQPTLLQGCATSACHGSSAGGKFQLFIPADTDAATYTNFYILTQYAKRVDASTTLSMIDRTSPQKSLLLQYSLPAEVSDFDHPDVPGYKGLIRTAGDPRYKAMLDWLTNSLQPVAPDYGIKYALPGATPTSGPSTRPAAGQ